MEIGLKIKEFRISHELTQKEFAEKICISQSHLSRVERGVYGLGKSTLKLVCIIFNISEEFFK